MGGYKPTKIAGMETGLIQSREEFLLPNDAFPTLENAYIWRERIRRKLGTQLLGRLRRLFTAVSIGNSGASVWSINAYSSMVPPVTPEATAQIEIGSVSISIGAIVFVDDGDGNLSSVTPGNSGTINYLNGNISLTHTAGAGIPSTITFGYFPGLPVMGLCDRELTATNNEMLIAFDTKYAYRRGGTGWIEFIPGTTWTGNDSDFFWTTNYWVSATNQKLFWATNFSGTTGDPMRYTDGTTWTDFAPALDDPATTYLQQALILIPFRSRLLAINTLEGATLGGSTAYPNRIRWAAIGSPITSTAWNQVIGKGGFIDIPTAQHIIAVGFVRDNLVIYCERSTWQLRYTGQSIQPFQIEKVNTELGAESTFSAVPFDTTLVGIGDKGIVYCDSFKSERMDIKIVDFVFSINNLQNGRKRVHGIRDYIQKMAYWTYPTNNPQSKFPNRRLAYNYENNSWAIFTDCFTCFGNYQPSSSRTWAQTHYSWASQHILWSGNTSESLLVVGGNHQGYVSILDQATTNDKSLFITAIAGNDTTATLVTSPSHNLQTGQVIKITGIIEGSDFDGLNDVVFGIVKVNANSFYIYTYQSTTGQFDYPQLDSSAGVYTGGGEICVLDNFSILSKKFEHMNEGQQIQVGHLDVLLSDTDQGAITLKMYVDYRDDQSVSDTSDTFFNRVIPTGSTTFDPATNSKNWHRAYFPLRGQFIKYEYTLSNAQMNGIEQQSAVEIAAQILWERAAGRLI
jgi:hypothetical protein